MPHQKHSRKHAQIATHNWGKTGRCKRCGVQRVADPRGGAGFDYFLPDMPQSSYGKRPPCLKKPAKVQPRRWRPGDKRARGTHLLSKEEILRDSGVLPARIGVY